jgi:hypothetical protein
LFNAEAHESLSPNWPPALPENSIVASPIGLGVLLLGRAVTANGRYNPKPLT